MYRWNSTQIEQDLAALPGIANVDNQGPGGDFDTDTMVLEIAGCEDCLWIRGFDHDTQQELPHKSDIDVPLVEVTDGLCYSGGLNSTQIELIKAYAEVRIYFANAGADVVDQIKDYF